MPPPVRISKVLNSSVVLATDEDGRESILLGKGIGYGRKVGESVADGVADRVFLPIGDPDSRALIELLGSTPGTYVLLAREIISRAHSVLKVDLDRHLLLALTDHLSFAVQRMREGMRVTNRLSWEMRTYYPDEYQVGLEALGLVNERLGTDLPPDEATNIAFHLVNARNDPRSDFDALRAATLISDIVSIVAYRSGLSLVMTDLDHRRFLVHLQFFVDRLFTGRLLDSDDGFLYEKIRDKYPRATEISHLVAQHVLAQHQVVLPADELGYLGLHIQRLLAKTSEAAGGPDQADAG